MNISATGATGVSATYRIIAAEGFHPGDFNLFRNMVALTVAILWSSCSRVHPIKDLPKGKRWPVFGRMLFGQTNFVLLILAYPLAPISLIMVTWQINPFWISLMSCIFLKEKILLQEIVAICICFTAIAVIAH